MKQPHGTISGPVGDPALGGTVSFTATIDFAMGGGRWPMVSCFAWQDSDGDGDVDAGDILNDDVVYGELRKPTEVNGKLVAEFILGGGGSYWKDNGGPATCEAVLWQYTRQGDITRLDSTGFWPATG